MIPKFVLLALIFISVSSIAQAPTPYCNSKKVFRQGPLAIQEKVLFDIADGFSGYNLDIKVASNSSTVTLNPKFAQLDKKTINIHQLISHHIQSVGNKWGKQSFLLFKDIVGSIQFGHGLFQKEGSLPIIDYTFIVTTDKNVNCYGAALFYDHGLAIVDCTSVNSENQLINKFYYLDLVNHNVSKIVDNDMFIPFQQITKRKLFRFTDHQTGYTYLLRSYLHDGVEMFKRNTYMQLFSAADPNNLQLLRVIDRSILHLSSKDLQIVDVQVYQGNIYFLDLDHGLFRLDVTKGQQIRITGRYRKDGCYKFAVYSDDLENEVIVAIANSHAVYQVNLADFNDPFLINKYSLMQYSYIRQIYMNDKFLIVQSAANATDSSKKTFEIDYTWIFTKGSRTYTNAYHVINHNSSQVQLDLNNYNNQVIIADQGGITLYQLSNQIAQLYTEDNSKIGTEEDVIFIANSTDPFSKEAFACQLKLHLFYTNINQTNIWEPKYDNPQNFSINYPGQLQIALRSYFTGANLTYQIKNTDSLSIPTYWVDKVNQTNVSMDGNIGNSIFFHTQVIPEIGDERIIFFDQDAQYKTHVVQCRHIWESLNVVCVEQVKYDHRSQITAFTTAFFLDKQIGFNYYYIIVFQQNLKVIHGYDYIRHKNFFNITYEGLQQAQISSIASSNGYLFVLRGNIKTIDVYKLSKCSQQSRCQIQFSINAEFLKAQGISYFAPKKLITDFSHPQVLFIQCLGSVLVVDVDNKQHVTVLGEILSDGAQNLYSQVAVNKDRLMIVSEPDNIEIFSIQHIYSRRSDNIVFLKNLPLYNYEVPIGSDIQFSDVDPLVYVNAKDPSTNKSIVLIYNTLESTDSSLYAVIPLPQYYTRPALQIEVSGFIVDFLTIKTPKGFRIFRVFDFPVLSIKDVSKSINFTIGCKNPGGKNKTTDKLALTTLQTDMKFKPTQELNKTISGLTLQYQGNYTWDDKNWFSGHITGYNFTCEDCGNKTTGQVGKVRVREHVQTRRVLPINANDYVPTDFGGFSVGDDLVQFFHNGSIHKIIHLPDQKTYQYCQKIATNHNGGTIFTGCNDQTRGVNIYITTISSFKQWTWGPFQSSADGLNNMQVAGDILAITDTSPYPNYKFTKGAVYLYSQGFDISSSEELDELQIINQDDLIGAAHGYDKQQAYIANSHLTYAPFSKVYRLYLTQVDDGLFVVDFKYELGSQFINILTVQFIDLKKVLIKANLHMPSDASFFAVGVISGQYHPKYITENAIITVNKYHNLEVELAYDDNNRIVAQNLVKIYHRYGYYDIANSLQVDYAYLAIPYKLPPIYQVSTNNTKQILGIYDVSLYADDNSSKVQERFMIGGFRYNKTSDLIYGFNRTFDIHSNGTRTGLVVTSHFTDSRQMYQVSLSKNLTAHLDRDFKNQQLTITAYSDFSSFSFEITLFNFEQQQQFILAIIIIILVAITTLGFVAYIFVIIRKKKTQREQISQQRVSLLTDSQTIRDSISVENKPVRQQKLKSSDSGYQSDSQSSQSQQNSQENNSSEGQDDTLQAHASREGDQASEDKLQQDKLQQAKLQQAKLQQAQQNEQKNENEKSDDEQQKRQKSAEQQNPAKQEQKLE